MDTCMGKMGRSCRIFFCCAAVMMALLFFGSPTVAGTALKVLVMIEPQKYFVEQIGGNRVAVTVMVPPGADPHLFEPKPRTMVEASQVDVYVSMGVPEEQSWLPKLLALSPNLPVIRQDQGIKKRVMEGHHDHETATGHAHEPGLDPHIWLSPKLAILQVQTLTEGLCTADPAGASEYQARSRAFQQQITDLDRRLSTFFDVIKGPKTFLAVHPSWGYFAQDYGLTQVSVEVEGKEPSAQGLALLIERTRQERIPVLLVQPQFSQRLTELVVRETGVKVIKADPLAADWMNNLEQLGRQLAQALSGGN